MHIDIWSDIACPWSYLGVRHMRQALASFPRKHEVTIRLHAYLLQPELDRLLDESEPDFMARTKGMSRAEVDEALLSISKLARQDGIEINWDQVKVAPTTNAHRLVGLAREVDIENDTTTGPDTLELRVNEALQRARFEYGMDVSHPETLINIAQDFDIEGGRVLAALESQETAGEVFSDFQIGVQMGVDAVPVFVFDQALIMQGTQPRIAFENALVTAWNHSNPEDPVEGPVADNE
ncbi:MAG: DsbA family oxidoreductase [Actinomycetaceae bacterium]|nr:DsbA family oxidoreductase [Actinomycetaceae bacterium]